MKDTISIAYGDGGKYTHELINNVFYKYFDNEILKKDMDSAVLSVINDRNAAFTTDSFVVKPLFFPGGDIGRLSICGTANDLSVSGAKPLYMSCSFIIEEGLKKDILEKIVRSMADECRRIGVKIVTGDTKVVEKGAADEVFINTAGIGVIENNYKTKKIEPGDDIIVTGSVGNHGTVIALERYNIEVKGNFKSDCAPVYEVIKTLKNYYPFIKMMKDPTRGGIATILNEISDKVCLGIRLVEGDIPVDYDIRGINEMLGLDPLYMACEGRAVIVAKKEVSSEIVNKLRKLDGCKDASIIGSFVDDTDLVYIENAFGGKRILSTLDCEMIPRIC